MTLRDWLVGNALDSYREITTWLLVAERRLMAYHTLSPAKVSLPSGQSVEASNIRFLARSGDCAGVVPRVLEHARRETLKVGHAVMTLDPFDHDVAAIWRGYGFRDSETNLADESDPIYRQFVFAADMTFRAGRRGK